MKEHDDLLNQQLEPLADRLNRLVDRLEHFDRDSVLRPAREQLDDWRRTAIESIEEVYREKLRRLNESLDEPLRRLREETRTIQDEVRRLIQEEGTTQQQIDTFTANIERVDRETNEILVPRPSVNEVRRRWELSRSLQMRFLFSEDRHYLSGNDTQILVYDHRKLSLLDHNLNLHRSTDVRPELRINAICWSTRWARFLVLTDKDLFLLDGQTLSLERSTVPTRTDGHWHHLTCSTDSLYLTLYTWGTYLRQYHFGPTSLDFHRQVQLPIQSPKDHSIDHLIYHHATKSLAMLIQQRIDHRKQFHLRFEETLECLWSIELDPSFATIEQTRFCLFNDDHWLLIHPNQRQLIAISTDGSIEQTVDCPSAPIHDVLHIREDFLLLTTTHSLNLHQLF